MTPSEQVVYDALVSKGYTVTNKGWPDFLAWKDGRAVAIEVKQGQDWVKPHQNAVHETLRMMGLPVQTIHLRTNPEVADKRVSEALETVFEQTQPRDLADQIGADLELRIALDGVYLP